MFPSNFLKPNFHPKNIFLSVVMISNRNHHSLLQPIYADTRKCFGALELTSNTVASGGAKKWAILLQFLAPIFQKRCSKMKTPYFTERSLPIPTFPALSAKVPEQVHCKADHVEYASGS